MKKFKLTRKSRNNIMLIMLLLIVVLGLLGVFLFKSGIASAASAAQQAFQNAYETEKQATYDKFYDTSYNISEKKNHVSNNVSIMVEDIREEAKLEVLQVSDVEYVYDEDSDDANVWTSIRGHGTYSVDLSLSEFLIDNERHYVLIRVPAPEYTASLDYTYENYLYDDGIFNGSIEEGVDKARGDLAEATRKLNSKLSNNQNYYDSAETAAETMISLLVKNLNPEIDDLQVEIEFME